MSEWGDETVTIVEIDQPLCDLVYGTLPCTAVLGTTGSRKCYNSRATCQDPDNYTPGTLTLRFARPQEGLLQYGNVIPSIGSISTTAGSINLAAMDRNASALGQREVVTIRLDDHLHSDHLVDKYRLERATGAAQADGVGYDPYERGTFWGKWLARNPYHTNYRVRVRQGVMGQPLEEMRTRHYIIDRIDGPTDGSVTLVAKDLFSRIEAKKAVAPAASRGELSAAITATDTTATLSPAGIGDLDYPASGRVAIGDEIIAFDRAGDTLTLTARGDLSTEADSHDAEDLVQVVLSYASQRAHNITYDLLVNYTALTAADINKAAWDAEAEALPELYTGHIAKPTPVQDLVGELSEQAGFTVWPEVSTGLIEFVALTPTVPTGEPVDDNGWIVDGSLATKRQTAKRVSQTWVYYAQINPTEDLTEKRNYRSRLVTGDLVAEDDQHYGAKAIREVFSRWIPQFGRGLAETSGERILSLFRDPPMEARFAIHASRSLALARNFRLRIAESQDDTGALLDTTHAPVEIEWDENELTIRSQQIRFFDVSEGGTGERVIHIENDDSNLNLRTIHDTLFDAPTGTETVRFIVDLGIIVGSTAATDPAVVDGTWPEGTVLRLEINGRIQGMGGKGGKGGDSTGPTAGSPGETGGTALRVRRPITIANNSELWGGAGGAGGGGAGLVEEAHPEPFFAPAGGGGGGGGAGTEPGGGAPGGDGDYIGGTGGAGTASDGGAGGAGPGTAGDGGKGGLPGEAGQAGQNGERTAGGAGGAAGYYIDGDVHVTWEVTGDRKGRVA
jgi:hypothetical protein